MAHDRNRDVENLLASAADRTRNARAELSAAARDLALAPDHRLSDQQRALIGDIFAKLVATIELDLRQQLAQQIPAAAAGDAAVAQPRLEAAGLLYEPSLLRLVMRRAEEHRLALIAADGSGDAASSANLLDSLARNPDAELARRAIAHVLGEARRRDRLREPLLPVDDLPEWLAWRLHWQVAAALRAHLLSVVDPVGLARGLEAAVRQAMAERREAQAGPVCARRLAARLHELGALDDEFLMSALAQGQLLLFAAGIGVRAALDHDAVWELVFDRGSHSLLVLLRAIGMPAAIVATIVEFLDAGLPLARPPSAQRALLAAYAETDAADADRLLRGWQLDPGFREAIDDLEEAGRR